MKLLVEAANKNMEYDADGYILALDGYSVESVCYYTLDEIRDLKEKTNKEIFMIKSSFLLKIAL